jgi:type IV secretory pathway TrbD component
MTTTHRTNPVYRAVNKPLTVGGVERRMFGIVMIGGLLVLIAFGMTGAAITFGLLFVTARWATKEDYQLPRIVMTARRFRSVYDPARREWYMIR